MVKYQNHHPTDIATKAINIKGAELNDRQGCVSVFCLFNGGISYDIINTVSHLPNIISYKYYPNQLDQFAKAPTETPRPRRRVHSTLIPFCIYRGALEEEWASNKSYIVIGNRFLIRVQFVVIIIIITGSKRCGKLNHSLVNNSLLLKESF